MALDTDISDWTLEHDRAVRDVVRLSTVNYRNSLNENFPSNVMVVGNNWFYIAELGYLRGLKDKPLGSGATLALSQAFTINAKQAMETRKYVPLEKILDDFRRDLGEEYALFPIVERRVTEARALGEVKQQRDDWFEVYCTDGRKIKMFPLQPREQAFYFGKTAEGGGIGYTPLEPNPH